MIPYGCGTALRPAGRVEAFLLKLRAVAGRLALAGVSTLLMLVVLEIALRLLGPPPPPPEDSLRTFTEYDANLGWRGRPGAKGTYRTSAFLIDVALNRDGFRDDEPAALPTTIRFPGNLESTRGPIVALLGDSFAWGFGVNRGEMFADRVEAAIPRCRVENLSVCGYGTDQELLVLKSHPPLRPDVVLVEFAVGNDLDNILSARAYNLPKPRFLLKEGSLSLTGSPVPRTANWDRAARTSLRDFATAHVRLYAWVRPRWGNLRGRAARMMPFLRPDKQGLRVALLRRSPSERVERGWRLAEALLAEIARIAASSGSRTMLLVVPDRIQVEDGLWSAVVKEQGLDPADYDRDLPDRRLAEIGTRLGITIVDPLEALRARAGAGEDLFVSGDPHWNAAGHRVAAEALVSALVSALALAPPPSPPRPSER